MGHGPARELSDNSGPAKTLDATLAAKLSVAVQRLDALNPDWAQAREDERMSQLAKSWGGTSATIEGYLRSIGQAIILSHQISTDMGTDGGGREATPFIEETSDLFPRLEFSVQDDGSILAATEDLKIAEVQLEHLSYDWVERCVVEWLVTSIASLQ